VVEGSGGMKELAGVMKGMTTGWTGRGVTHILYKPGMRKSGGCVRVIIWEARGGVSGQSP
jgi:hypothetical protein